MFNVKKKIFNFAVIPAAYFQHRLFALGRPNYVNYAAIGQFIGQMISYGFGAQGRQFDAEGNLGDWWDKETEEKFANKSKCMLYQYGNYTDKESGLPVRRQF